MDYRLSHLKQLESEAIFVIREAAAQFERPVLLFSGGKDSITLAYLARKAFFPAKIPFPFMHVDTGHNFPETLRFRDEFIARMQARLIVASVQQTIDEGKAVEEKGPNPSRNGIQSITLLDAIEQYQFDACLGGARRDEEKARAKERFFSHRDEFGQWEPKNQRPELWDLFNGFKHAGENFRVFPLSNWTEMDVWMYLKEENVPLPSLYFAHKRRVVNRGGVWLADTPFNTLLEGEQYEEHTVRFRTIGDATCTGAFLSNAKTIDEVIAEVAASRITERGGRADDKRSDSAMEDRKKQGYF
ncbi:MAG: sulfate adenylyltransferase subunit 2 [Bacteroidetes bacterium]|nr:MAG: sulfate adenylyltransferase subunit 2 [Bacteroidota bacterium]